MVLFNSQEEIDYKEVMRNFVKDISNYAKSRKSNFVVISNHGLELITVNGTLESQPHIEYLTALDGILVESLLYGVGGVDMPTPITDTNYLKSFLNITKNNGKKILIIDYCSNPTYVNNSYNYSNSLGYISFAADHRNLNNIPSYPTAPYNENSLNIDSFQDTKNFLILLNPSSFATKTHFLNTLMNTNYDLIIIDLFFGSSAFNLSDINSLKNKANGVVLFLPI